jgi:branched-chain amino acid transport system substrate-binding protein
MGVIGVACMSAALLAACSSQSGSGSGSSYTFGVLVSQTGSASQLGVGEAQGAQLAADQINAKGGVNGRKIVIKVEDDQTLPDQDVALARGLIRDKVTAILGPSVTAGCAALMPLVKQSGPVQYCLSPGISPAGYTLSSSANTTDLALEALRYWKQQGITRIGLLSTTDASGANGAVATESAAKATGVSIVAKATYDPTAVSVTSELQQATQGHPQALVLWATGTPTGVALKAIQAQGLSLPVFTTDGNLANAFLQRIAAYTPKTLLIPATRDFWYRSLPKTDPVYALENAYHTDYQNKYHDSPDFGPGVGYDAVLVLAQALKTAKSSDSGALRSAIENLRNFQ